MSTLEALTALGSAEAAKAVGAPEAAEAGQAAQPLDSQQRAGARSCSVSAHPRPDGEDRYTISEVAAYTGLSAHTLRWYERIGLMPHVDRSHTGQRRFTNRDLGWLSFVSKLRLCGMPVADMVRYAELVREGEHTSPERQELLVAHRDEVRRRIAELQESLAVLDYKINTYADVRRASERG